MPSIASVSANSRKFARVLRFAVLVGCGVAVAGCTAGIETFRSLRGFNKNDANPVSAPFVGNMAAAETAPYPNLASVPPPPTRVTTAAERQRLAEGLVAERAAAAQAAAMAGAANTAVPGAETGATPAPPRLAAAPPQPIPAHAAPAADPPIPGPGAIVASNQADPNQVLPRDSELRMPQVRSLPEPDDPRPAPPSPRLRPVPPPEQPSPAAIAGAAPQPAPSVPDLAPIAPPPVPSLARTETPPAAAGTTVAMLDAPDPGQIAQVASRYKEDVARQPPRAVRVIAYTAPPAPGTDPLGLYHDALHRAREVATALSVAGIPEKIIQTEARPAAGQIAAARIEIQFLP